MNTSHEAALPTLPPQEQSLPHLASKKAFYHPELDVLRFFAFFIVFLGHLDYSPFAPLWPTHILLSNLCFAVSRAGSAGLTLFFVLSSFLITELLLREHAKTGAIHFRDFYLRRILRIWPLYFFFLLIVRPLYAHFFPWDHFSPTYLVAFLLLAGNWILIIRGVSGSIADPLWSISIEEQFYLGWPLVVRYFRRHIPAIACAMILISMVVRIAILVRPSGDLGLSIWCNTLARIDTFALGALAAWYLHNRDLRIQPAVRCLLVVLCVFTLLLTGRYGDHVNDRSPLTYPLESLACVALLIAVLLPMRSWVPGPLGRAAVYMGRISYGLYVFHVLFIRLVPLLTHLGFFAANALALLMTTCAASLSYAFLEKPFLRWKQRFTYVKSRP